jgi:hydroxymethylpyrimidine kinase/phosphomethylpyrimidine kinase
MQRAVQQSVLSIAGSDPSGGAGVQADIKTISALGGYAMAALTALTAQNTHGVRGVHVPAAAFVREQLDALSDDVRIDAVKIGMLANAGVATEVAQWLARSRPPFVVLDPVMVSRSGHRLLDADAVATIREELCPAADLVTPNLPELADLLQVDEATCWAEALGQGRALAAATGTRVLVKGGHLDGSSCPDALVEPDGRVHELAGERVQTRSTHGTGCTLSAALATLRPIRPDWLTTARDAKDWLAKAIAAGDQLRIGSGFGPVHHFHTHRSDADGHSVSQRRPSFTEQVWLQTRAVRTAIDELPFVRGLADGTLPAAAFEEYLRQDGLYLEQYARALATLAALAPGRDEQLFWSQSAQQCLLVERELHESWVELPATALAGSSEPPVASATCTAYTSYLLAVAHRGDYAELVAAVLPCFWVYADVGERLQQATSGQPDHPYRRWIDQYGDPAFAVRTMWVRGLADRLAEHGGRDQRRRMSQAFATATRYEWMFWDSPWRGEHWPV